MLTGFRIILILGFIIGGAASFTGCGPVNGEKKISASSSGPSPSLRTVSSSKNEAFLVYSTLQTASGQGTAAVPQVGDNVFLLRCVHARDLRGVSEQAKVTVTYWMPDMPAMGKSEATATRQAEGTYAVTLFFSMAGKWQMIVSLQDGDSKDEYVFETTI